MGDELRQRLDTLARRAGLRGVPPGVVVAAAACLALLVAFALWHWWPEADSELITAGGSQSGTAEASVGSVTGERGRETTATIWVHVVGAVNAPGVYEVLDGSRVVAAVEAAGGLLPDAAQDCVNLAASLSDGEQVVVPTKDGGTPVTGAGGGAGTGGGGPVNINTADAALLDTLPGVGPVTAEKIVADREANGLFKSVDDLGRVSGFGDKKLAQLEGLICVR